MTDDARHSKERTDDKSVEPLKGLIAKQKVGGLVWEDSDLNPVAKEC